MIERNEDTFFADHGPLAQSSKVFAKFDNPIPIGTKRLLFTAAQNGTPVHAKFWRSLLHAREFYGAHLSVGHLRYKNPTSVWTRAQEDAEEWDPVTAPYWLNQRMVVNKNLVCTGEVKIVPTAATPLTGFESFTGAESTIVFHTRYQFKTVAVPGGKTAKLMSTSGACTVPNYSNSRAGAGGEFHHCLGALLVELDANGIFYMRHLDANDNGEFIDGPWHFTPNGVKFAAPWEALALGDTHVRFTDPDVDRATFGKGGIVQTLKPKRLYWHDACDGYAVNPHHVNNPFTDKAKWMAGFDDIEGEVNDAIDFVVKRTPANVTSYLVPDNHGEFLGRWIKSADWKKLPPKQRAFYFKTALAMDEGTRMGASGAEIPSAWEYWVKQRAPNLVCLSGYGGEGSRIGDIQMDMHGHKGQNGAKGNIRGYKRIGVKSIIAHSHSPGADEWAMQIGTSSLLRLEYNDGLSSWLQAHAGVNALYKRQLIVMVNGRWRLNQPPPGAALLAG